MLGSGSMCRFAYGPQGAPVAAATAPGAEGSRTVIKLHGRLVPMSVQYQHAVILRSRRSTPTTGGVLLDVWPPSPRLSSRCL